MVGIRQAQDVLRALRAAEDRLALYEVHLRRVAQVLAPSGDQRPEHALASTVADQLLVADAVLVMQDVLAGWLRLRALEVRGQAVLDQEGEPPF